VEKCVYREVSNENPDRNNRRGNGEQAPMEISPPVIGEFAGKTEQPDKIHLMNNAG
jgi:hypothetical protein